jgi:hypothetical protein
MLLQRCGRKRQRIHRRYQDFEGSVQNDDLHQTPDQRDDEARQDALPEGRCSGTRSNCPQNCSDVADVHGSTGRAK